MVHYARDGLRDIGIDRATVPGSWRRTSGLLAKIVNDRKRHARASRELALVAANGAATTLRLAVIWVQLMKITSTPWRMAQWSRAWTKWLLPTRT